jgi:hypothetical protein
MGLFPGEARSIGNTGPPSVFSGVSPVGPGQPEDGADKFLLWLFPPYPIGAGCDAIERAFAGPLRGAAVLLDASAKPFEVHALEKLLCSRFGGICRIRVPSPRLPWFFDRWVGSVPSS